MDRYDRQIRLWNSNGQHALANAALCLVNVSSAATETLKNIVLPGVHSVTIIDPQTTSASTDLQKVKLRNLKSNYFYTPEVQSEYIAENIASNLAKLNSDVSNIRAITQPLHTLIEDQNFWLQFDCVVYSVDEQTEKLFPALSDLLWNLKIPLIRISSIGFYAYYAVQFNQLNIIETHQNDLVDLRLDSPWPELQAYIDTIDISHASNPENYYKYPYSIILMKLFQNKNTQLNTREIRKQIQNLYLTKDETNLIEASKKAYLLMKKSSDLSVDTRELFDNIPLLTENTSLFWILVSSLKHFYDTFGQLPLSGVLSDMESDSVKYKELKDIYHEKFLNDKMYIINHSVQLLKSLNRSPAELIDNDHLVVLFVKNCKHLKILNGTKFTSNIDSVLRLLPENDNSQLYLAFKIFEKFVTTEKRFPTPNLNDQSKLRTLAISTLCIDQNLKSFPEGLDKLLDEISRYQGDEIHNISAVIGGITGQEIIKLLTNQYIPVDNTLVFDGINGKAHVFKF